jgi:murein DD-endopeptidase MepM/ murein hydrolase activator NlpD
MDVEGSAVLTLRSLRRSRGLTLVELALLTGIPARTLCAIEQGLQPLDRTNCVHLASALDLPVQHLYPLGQAPADGEETKASTTRTRRLALASVALLAGALLLSPLTLQHQPASRAWVALLSANRFPASLNARGTLPTPLPGDPVAAEPVLAAPKITATPPTPIPPTETPTPTPDPAALARGEPQGCPLVAGPGHVVITQGYNVGTHAPASVWGGLDLAIDADGDGKAEPGATYGVVVVATHSGTARVFLGSWPGGNYVRIENPSAGWNTAYAHLADVAVADGQELAAGTPIGTTGATGYATGPHLHYEVWRQGQNVDPTGWIACPSPDATH